MRLAAVPLLLTTLASSVGAVPQQPSSSGDGRVALLRGLERLMVTGEPRDVAHDDGELLQQAVTDAIQHGDTEVERLAVRAASPIVVRTTRLLGTVQSPPALEIVATPILTLPNAIPYQGEIDASVDGERSIPVTEIKSGGRAEVRLDVPFPRVAGMPGFHRVALRARLTFSSRDARVTPWTETRELPSVSYAVYDESSTATNDARAFLFGHLRVSARHFDADLPDVPLARWLDRTLRPRVEKGEPTTHWMAQFCDERTSEAGSRPRAGAVCAVGYFGPSGVIVQLWFRTGRIDVTEEGLVWVPEEPTFQAISMHEGGSDMGRLSNLPTLLNTSAESRARGDVSVTPADIIITGEGTGGSATITLRNQGSVTLRRVLVNIAVAQNPADRGFSRSFVVDVPANGSEDITLPVAFPAGYGVVVAMAMQISEHGTFPGWSSFDPTPEDAVAFRVFNAKGAPPGFVNTIREECGCRGW